MRKTNRTRNTTAKKEKLVDITRDIIQAPKDIQFRNRLKPKTPNQKEYIRSIAENVITFCQGIAGSGKTHIAIGMGLEYLSDEKVSKIVITRPVLEAGEKLGFLPGTAEEKLHPYLLPIIDEINHFIGMADYARLKNEHKIEIVPLALMRGRNFHDSFIIADECQNASYDQLKMLLTRIGQESKMVLTGDIAQSDLHRHLQGGFITMFEALEGVNGIGFTKLEFQDIVRNPIIADILARLEKYES